MKAAIYARFSTDLQSERSIDDQVALCQAYALREDLDIVAVHHDRAKSGASLFGRDGLMALMLAGKARAFDVLLVEHTDRLSRDMGDLADIHKRLTFAGVAIRAVHSGMTMSTATIGLFGLVGQMQREDGAKKVHRGMAGVVRDGRHAGGRAYGYRPVPGRPGVLAIEPAEADVVRRIFAAYGEGLTPRAIAGWLNTEGVPPPRGERWNASTLNGSKARGSGILDNPLYAGRIVWNRVRMVKDPETGRRISRPNAGGEHFGSDAPELALVDAATLAAVRARRLERGQTPGTMRKGPKRLLSGLLRCGACGSGMSAHDRDRAGKVRLRCSAVRESGACSHKRTYYAQAIETATVAGLRAELAKPAAIALYVKTYHEERRRLAGDAAGRRIKLTTRRGEIVRELERLVKAIAKGLVEPELVAGEIRAMQAEARDVEAQLAVLEQDASVIALHPTAIARYLGQIDNLSAALSADADLTIGKAAASFRSLIESVIVHPVPARAKLDLEIRGYLANLIQDPGHAPNRRLCGFAVVAEEGLEPPTRGL